MSAEEDKKQRNVVKTISLPPALLEVAEAMAEEDQRTFSSYVAKLIKQDVDSKAPATAA